MNSCYSLRQLPKKKLYGLVATKKKLDQLKGES